MNSNKKKKINNFKNYFEIINCKLAYVAGHLLLCNL